MTGGMAAELASQGWHLTEEGIASLGGSTAREAVSLALDTDFKVGMACFTFGSVKALCYYLLLQDIGSPCIPEEINRGKVDSIKGPLVLMVTKVQQKKKYLLYQKENPKIPGLVFQGCLFFCETYLCRSV